MRGRKGVWIAVVMAFTISLLGVLAYDHVIPRVEVKFKVIHHESNIGNLNVSVILTNEGNCEVVDIILTLELFDEMGNELIGTNRSYRTLKTGQRKDFGVSPTKPVDPGVDHIINVSLKFSYQGVLYSKKWLFNDDQGYMNVAFTGSIKDFFPE